jgi:hypothetical protein
MQISTFAAGQAGLAPSSFPGGLAAAAAALSDAGAGLDRQLGAYRTLASEWRASDAQGRAALAPALNDSPFARRAQAALNSFTRAAWAGPEATPPAPQAQALKAFDSLSGDDQQIVAALQAGTSPAEHRAKLAADLEAAQAAALGRKGDSITLSAEAQARLAGKPMQDAPEAAPDAPPQPVLSPALAAYARAAGG